MSQKAIKIAEKLPTTPESFDKFLKNVKDTILSGDRDILPLVAEIKLLEKVVEVTKDKEVKDAMERAFDLYGEKNPVVGNFTFRKQMTGVKYDYTVCGDPTWDDLNTQISALEDKKKKREEYLKALYEPVPTMEGVIINPPVKSGSMSVISSFRKTA